MTQEEYEKVQEIKSKMIMTHHGIDNLKHRRPYVKKSHIAYCVAFGNKGFAGNRRLKSTDFKHNLEVIWKQDRNTGEVVVITYYKINKNKYREFRKMS